MHELRPFMAYLELGLAAAEAKRGIPPNIPFRLVALLQMREFYRELPNWLAAIEKLMGLYRRELAVDLYFDAIADIMKFKRKDLDAVDRAFYSL